MLKSRLLASGAFLLAISCTIPVGLSHFTPAERVVVRAQAQETAEASVCATEGLEFAVALSNDAVSTAGTNLDYATSTEVVSLPSTSGTTSDASCPGISVNDPIVQRTFAEKDALPSKAPMSTGSSSHSDSDFVFDINKTIFPVTEEEVEMLKYVVEAEGGTGSLEDKRLVTFSITNRIFSKNFPDTLYEVLHSVNQFSTIQNYYSKKKIPSESTCRAVEEVLMGACPDNSQNALYFYCTAYPVADWIVDWFENDLVYLYTVGCDRFFTDPIPQ